MLKQLTIGLFGFGVVGEGLYKVLSQTPSLNAKIKRVCIKNPEKKRNAPQELFTTEKDILLNDEEINLIVELIDDADAAFPIVRTALYNGKDVISANKKMLAHNLFTLLQIQKETGRSLLYEASACASIPIIRNLEEYYDNDLLQGISAIVNGSTNFILTKMFEENLDFKEALLLAQQLGFAESNPKLDIEGFDAVNKWSLLLLHAYGIVAHPDDLLFNGIQNLNGIDAQVAANKKQQIKLIAQAKKLKSGKVAAFVLPQFISVDDNFAFAKNEYNAVVLESGLADKQFFLGKGAGAFPTASAVLSDIAALRYDYKYEYKKLNHHDTHQLTGNYSLKIYISFDDVKNIVQEDFISIDQWHRDERRSYVIGEIAYETLKSTTWWKENGNSLILLPDAINEEANVQSLKKKSIALATAFL